MARLDVMKTISTNKGKINIRYDLDVLSFNEILDNSMDSWDLIYNSFVLGYAQGMKAIKAEMKKAANRSRQLTAKIK